MQGRNYWEKLVVLDCERMENSLVVNIGANEPPFLFKKEAEQLAKKTAKKLGYPRLVDTEDDARLYGQNNLVERMFYFSK